MEVTPSGKTISFKLLQPSNANLPIEVNPSGKTISCKLLQPENAQFSMEVTPSGKTISLSLKKSPKVLTLIKLKNFDDIILTSLLLS